MDPQDQAQEVNKYINDSIKFADAKAGIVLTFICAVGTALGVAAPAILEAARTLHTAIFVLGIVACGLAALSVLMVLWHALAAISPRIDRSQGSIVSLPDIAALDPKEYMERASSVSSNDATGAYVLHNVTLSGIAVAKFEALSHAVIWARVSLFAAYAALLIYAIATVAH